MGNKKIIKFDKGQISSLSKDIHRCLKKWNKSESRSLQIFGQSAVLQIEKGLAQLIEKNSFDAQLLSLRFIEGQTILSMAHHFHLSQDQINRKQRKALHELAQTIWRTEFISRNENSIKLLASLPPKTYDQLFGYEQIHEKLLPILLDKSQAQIIALTGLGGIGKSAITDSLLRELSQNSPFARFLWLRMELQNSRNVSRGTQYDLKIMERIVNLISDEPIPSNDWLKYIRSDFAKYPTLLVLDNFNDDPLSSSFFNSINQLVNPGKIVLTSRAKIPAGAEIFQMSVPEIDRAASEKLILHYAKAINLPASPNDLKKNASKIFQVTGGNPLAIRLALGLLLSFPLDEVLHSLERSPHSDVEAMYRFIYQRSWQALSSDARNLLQAMPLVAGEGATWAHLEALSGKEAPILIEIVKELSSRSLFELRGSLNEPVYGIHQLTDTFIRNDVLQWI